MKNAEDWSKNANRIITDGFSCRASEQRYRRLWPDEPATRRLYDTGRACLSCVYYAEFHTDWGLCRNSKSRHHLETLFEHFTCPTYVDRTATTKREGG
jgi:hypothetical protein